MFLLIPIACDVALAIQADLHSTMFLLIHTLSVVKNCNANIFTFHNVSINSIMERTNYAELRRIYIPQCFY